MKPLEFRSIYGQSDKGLSGLDRLVKDVLRVDVSRLDRLGRDPSLVSFGWWLDDELVANVSLYERRLWLAGEQVQALGIESVAVRPEFRGRGLYRNLMERALRFADAKVALVVLTSGNPGIYLPFGFRHITEATFTSRLTRKPSRPAYRKLSLDNDVDIAFLQDIFSRRIPTSLVASSFDHPAIFLLTALERPEIELLHLTELGVVVAVKGRNGPSMALLDIVGPSIPSVGEIVAALDYGGERINVHMTPDRLSWVPEEQIPIDNKYMVRGSFGPGGEAFMLSAMHI